MLVKSTASEPEMTAGTEPGRELVVSFVEIKEVDPTVDETRERCLAFTHSQSVGIDSQRSDVSLCSIFVSLVRSLVNVPLPKIC